MNEQLPTEQSPPQSDIRNIQEAGPTGRIAEPRMECGTDVSTASQPKAAKKLTSEEQMALYEKELKENDWGHQPC